MAQYTVMFLTITQEWGVVPSVQMNLGDLRDVITKGSYLPLISFKFYPDHKWIYELKLTEVFV